MTEHDADDADDEERREAQALAAALAGGAAGAAGDEPPLDALEVAALVRHAGHGDELSPERAEAVLQPLLAAPQLRRARRSARVVPWAAGLAAAAAVALAWSLQRPLAPSAAPRLPAVAAARALPSPSARLLSSQAELVNGSAAAAARFEPAMRAYRGELFRSLQRAYPAELGALDPAVTHRSSR